MTQEGHFIFGSGGGEVDVSGGHNDAVADYIATALSDPSESTTRGPDGLLPAESSARDQNILVHEAPGVLGMLDIHLGLDAGSDSVRFLVREAMDRGIRDPAGFRRWVAEVADAVRSRGLRLNADALVYHLKEQGATFDRFVPDIYRKSP